MYYFETGKAVIRDTIGITMTTDVPSSDMNNCSSRNNNDCNGDIGRSTSSFVVSSKDPEDVGIIVPMQLITTTNAAGNNHAKDNKQIEATKTMDTIEDDDLSSIATSESMNKDEDEDKDDDDRDDCYDDGNKNTNVEFLLQKNDGNDDDDDDDNNDNDNDKDKDNDDNNNDDHSTLQEILARKLLSLQVAVQKLNVHVELEESTIQDLTTDNHQLEEVIQDLTAVNHQLEDGIQAVTINHAHFEQELMINTAEYVPSDNLDELVRLMHEFSFEKKVV